MEQIFADSQQNPPPYRRSPERLQNEQYTAVSFQNVDDGTISFHRDPVQRGLEADGWYAPEGRTHCSQRCMIEVSVWLFLLIVHASAVIMGLIFFAQCPGKPVLPSLLLIMGNSAIAFLIYIFIKTEDYSGYLKRGMPTRIKIFLKFFTVLWIAETGQCFMSVSFDPAHPEYCHVVFHAYGIFFSIFTVLLIAVGFLIMRRLPERTVYTGFTRNTPEIQRACCETRRIY